MASFPIRPINEPLPMKYFYTLLLTGACLMMGGQSFAQKGKEVRVTVDFKQTPVADVLQELEKQTGYRFFYDTTDFDSTKIDIKADAQLFTSVLDKIFSGTDISYSLDRQEHVFIGKGEAIRTDLPPGFFDKGAADKEASGKGDSIRAYLEQSGKPPVATPENKLYVIVEKTTGPLPGIVNVSG